MQNREQSDEVLVAVDEKTGITRTLLEERDDAWLNIDEEMPVWLGSGSGFLWTSEREGAWALELYDPNGKFVRRITDLDLGYRGFVAVVEAESQVWVKAGRDPTEVQIVGLPLFLRPPVERNPPVHFVTQGAGLHGAVISKDQPGVWVHTFDGLNGERSQTVILRNGHIVGSLPSVAETPSYLPRLELTTVRSNNLEFHAAVIRPRSFNPKQHYPVMVDVYGGPHAQTVQASSYRYLLDQWFADQGFVVVCIDGRGTPARGRAWERALRGSYVDVPLQDQVAGLQALGKKYKEMDMDRVGVCGWSYGGYMSAMAVMRRPDVYKAGVAGAPVSNWLDYDTHYTERYIGLPDAHPEAYEESSVLTSAPELSRPLLIIHGTDDDNVYFTHSVQLADALYRAGKPFEFLPLSGFTHTVTDPIVTEMLEKRIADFFTRELGGPKPLQNTSLKHSKKG